VQRVVLGVDCDLVRLNRADTSVGNDFTLGAQLVPDPAQPDLADTPHLWCRAQRLRHLIDQGRVDGAPVFRINPPSVPDEPFAVPENLADRGSARRIVAEPVCEKAPALQRDAGPDQRRPRDRAE
jgi:hypothetical protein